MIEKSETFIGLITTTEGLRPAKMTIVNLQDAKEANHQTCSTMGFRFIYGRTEQGEVYEFIKAGKFCRRDLENIKKLGVIEAVTSWAWCPKKFSISQGEKEITKSFELGKETTEHFNRWLKAMYA